MPVVPVVLCVVPGTWVPVVPVVLCVVLVVVWSLSFEPEVVRLRYPN